MKSVLSWTILAIAMILLIGGTVFLWMNRPGRPALVVNGRVLTVRELDLRAKSRMDDALKFEHVTFPPGKAAEAFESYRLLAARAWLMRELFLDEAIATGVELTPDDEREQYARQDAILKKYRGMSLEEFFKTGEIPESVNRRDFKEGILAAKFQMKALEGRVKKPTPAEVEERLSRIRFEASLSSKDDSSRGELPDRRTVEMQLRSERQNEATYELVCELYDKADIRAPGIPVVETRDGAFPPRTQSSGK